jgi:hypothetical protein
MLDFCEKSRRWVEISGGFPICSDYQKVMTKVLRFGYALGEAQIEERRMTVTWPAQSLFNSEQSAIFLYRV